MLRLLIPAFVPVLAVLQATPLPLAAQTAPNQDQTVPGQQGPQDPALRDRLGELFDQFRRQIDPGLEDLLDLLGDLSGWHAPEVLPNGDILIRRRRPVETPPPSQVPEGDGPVTDPFAL